MAHGLHEEVFGRDAHVVVEPLVEGVGRDDGDGCIDEAELACAADRFPAVDARHREVDEHRIGPVAGGNEVQRIVAAGRRAQLETQRRKHMLEQFAIGLFVVDHKKAAARTFIAAARARHRHRLVCTHRRVVHARQEEPNAEQRAHARRALHLHLAAHQVGQHLGDGEAEARARRRRGRRIAAREGLEDAVDVFGGHARARVLDLDGRELACIRKPQRDLPRRRELDRIAQQVDEDLPHPLLVGAHHLGQGAARLETKLQPLLGRLQLEHVGQLPHGVGKAHRPCMQRELAGLDVRDGQRAFDEREQMLPAALDHRYRLLAMRRHRVVLAHQLRITQDAVERRAQFVADGADVAALGLVGLVGGALGLLGRELGLLGDFPRLFGGLFCGLQGAVGFAVQLDLAQQQVGLAVRLFLRHLAALVRKHQPPRHDARDDQERHVRLEKPRAQRRLLHARPCLGHAGLRRELDRAFGQRPQLLLIEHAEHHGQERHDDQHQQQEVPQARVQVAPAAARQQPAQCAGPLRRQARMRLAQVAAARIERATQRADRALVGGAVRHVRPFVLALADHTVLHLQALVAAALVRLDLRPSHRAPARRGCEGHGAGRIGRPRQVVLAAGRPRQQRRGNERGPQRDQRRERLRQRPEHPQVRGDRQHRGQRHRAHAHRVDVPEVRALELDARRRKPQRLVDDQVGHHRHHPGDGDVGEEAEHVAQRLEHVHLHQHERDERVEHHPHHPPRVAVRHAREEIAPGE